MFYSSWRVSSSPYSRLYWTEVSDFGSQMFYYSIINQTFHRILQPVATNHLDERGQCSCNVTEFELSGAMTIDTSDLKNPQIYFVKGQEIWAMDLEGCQCWQVIVMPALLGKTPMCVCTSSLVMAALPVPLKRAYIPHLLRRIHAWYLLWTTPNVLIEFKSSCFQANCI